MPLVSRVIIFSLICLFAACTTHSAKNDTDTVTPDGDVPIVDDAVEAEADDFIFVEADELLTDADTVVCPSMKSYANVKAAAFPLKDTNDRITFCRPGCDTPTENDPQCVRNLWEWLNWGRYQKYKNGTETFKECYPWPCEMPDMKTIPITYSECDKGVTSGGYTADMSALYDLRLQNGQIGILMMGASIDGLPSHRMISYNIAQDTFTTVAYAFEGTNGHDRFVFSSTAGDITSDDFGNTYTLSAKKNLTGYKYEVIYDDQEHMAWFSRPPLVGEKWVVLNIEHRTSKKQEVLYSKVDEWKWQKLIDGQVGEGNVVDNHVVLAAPDNNIYVCDLEKTPKALSDCTRIDRTGEHAMQPWLNEENKNQLVYFAGAGEYGLTLVDISTGTPKYTLLPVTPSDPNVAGMGPDHFRGNLILYAESFIPQDSSRADYKACFYRVDKKTQYCPSKPAFSGGRYDMGYNSFDGNYQLWKTPAGPLARFRDIQCYCEKEGVCPFEE